MKWMSAKNRPVRGLMPAVAGAHQRAHRAGTASGRTCASASHTASTMASPVHSVQAEVAAGSRAFSSEPSGAMTVSGRTAPSLKGMSLAIAWVANSASWLSAVVFGIVLFR